MEGCEFKNLKRQWNISQCGWGMSGWELQRVSVKWLDSDAYKLVQAWRAVGRSHGNDVPSPPSHPSTHPHTHTHTLWRTPPALILSKEPIRNLSFLSFTPTALRHNADLPLCCTPHISERWTGPVNTDKERQKGRKKEEEDKVVTPVFSLIFL